MTRHDQSLTFRHGGGWQGWFLSAPCFVMTLIVLIFFALPAANGEVPGNPLPIVLSMAVVFALVGFVILSLRWHKRICVSDGEVFDSFTILGIGRRRVIPLSEFTTVTLPSRTTRSQSGQGYKRYHVWIEGPNARVYLTEFSDPEQATQVARRVAEKTGLAIRGGAL